MDKGSGGTEGPSRHYKKGSMKKGETRTQNAKMSEKKAAGEGRRRRKTVGGVWERCLKGCSNAYESERCQSTIIQKGRIEEFGGGGRIGCQLLHPGENLCWNQGKEGLKLVVARGGKWSNSNTAQISPMVWALRDRERIESKITCLNSSGPGA